MAIFSHCLRWLGHFGCMGEERMPKQLLFGELEKKQPCCGPRDMISSDLRTLNIQDNRYELTQDRPQWHRVRMDGVEECQSKASKCAANRHSGSSDFRCQCGQTFPAKMISRGTAVSAPTPAIDHSFLAICPELSLKDTAIIASQWAASKVQRPKLQITVCRK